MGGQPYFLVEKVFLRNTLVKNVGGKGGKLLKSVKSEEKLQGVEEEVPVLKVDLKVESDSKVEKRNKGSSVKSLSHRWQSLVHQRRGL